MTHPQTQDDEALVEVIVGEMPDQLMELGIWLPKSVRRAAARAALTALRNHEGRK